MKIELLAKRIAQKTNTPVLEDILLGRGPELSNECMLWTGKKTQAVVRIAKDRNSQNIPVFYRSKGRAMGQIQVDGRIEYVHRLVFKILSKPDFEFIMRNICGNSLCCNPKHWDVKTPMDEVVMDDGDWTPEEVEETVDAMLNRYEVTCWADVAENPLMQDIPDRMIRDCLIALNKEHLT